MDQVHVIRWKVLVEGRSIRRIAREMRVSRNTVRKYLAESEPIRKVGQAKPRPVYEAVKPRVEELLEEWAGRTTAKQRITATRLHRELVEEGRSLGLTMVSAILREKRRAAQEMYVPLVHRPGDEAQVDFFEVTVEVGGERRRAWKFVLRLMFSGRDFVWLYERCDQVAFLDGHVRSRRRRSGFRAPKNSFNLANSMTSRIHEVLRRATCSGQHVPRVAVLRVSDSGDAGRRAPSAARPASSRGWCAR